jgi:hypothetical protein
MEGLLLKIVETSDWHKPHSLSKKSAMGHVFSASGWTVGLSLPAVDVESSDCFDKIIRENGGASAAAAAR